MAADAEGDADDELDDADIATRRAVLASVMTALGVGGVAVGARPARAATPDGYIGSATDPIGIYLADVRKPGNGDAVTVPRLRAKDESTDPSQNGEIRRNGADIKVYSGDGVRNLSNIGSGSGKTQEEIEDIVDGLLVGGTDIGLTYDDAGGSLTIDVTGSGGGGSAIEVQDDGNSLTTDATLVNVAGGLEATNPTGDEVDVVGQTVTTATGAVTAGEVDIVLGDASGGSFNVTLPSPSTTMHVTVKKTDSSTNAVTIATPGSETIDGQSNVQITSQYVTYDIVSDGSNYFLA
jgi:hypothetical protein